MDVYYVVEPSEQWLGMTRYRNFQKGLTYTIGDFVIVANEQSIKRQRTENYVKDSNSTLHDDHWIAQILEIRALDSFHVYARVSWMYWPHEIPPGTLQGETRIQGRQPYHGASELITSNHMDIIDVMSITGPTEVKRWIESDDEEIKDSFCYRQAYNCRNSLLSPVDRICKCQTPANPDRMLIGCTSSKCGKWMHYECLFEDVLQQALQRLESESSHQHEGSPVNGQESKGFASSFLPLKERGAQSTAKGSDGGTQGAASVTLTGENFTSNIKKPTSPSMPQLTTHTSVEGFIKICLGKDMLSHKPSEEFLKIDLLMEGGPIRWQIRDLRENVKEDKKCWTESVSCLFCGVDLE
ncbi:hypothetical protein ACHAP4_010950 [Fusarium culmorum]